MLFPSLHEGFGFPILEAMAAGLPVLTAKQGAMQEVAGDAALLVEPTDVDGMTVALWRVLSDGALRQQMSDKGLKRSSMFSWRRAAIETMVIYRSLAK